MAISTNGTIITRLAGALYGEYLSNASYTELNTTAAATVAANMLTNDFAGKTDSQVAKTVLTNLGLSSITGLDNWVAAQLTAAGSTAAAKGAKLATMLNDYAMMTADTTYGTYATSFNARVDASLSMSQTAGAKGGSFATADVVAISNANFTLTTGVDNFAAGAGNDSFTGNFQVGTSTTIQAGDTLSGGAGTDTLYISAQSTATTAQTLSGVSLSGIETVTVANSSAQDLTVSSSSFVGTTQVGNSGSSGNVTFSGTKGVTQAKMGGDAGNLTVTASALAYSGDADSFTLNVDGVAGNTTGTTGLFTLGDSTSGIVETLNIKSSGNSSTIGLADANDVKYLVVSGDVALTIASTIDTTVKSIDASGMSAGLTVTLPTSDISIVGGTGNDVVKASTTLTIADTINGGAGTDALRLTSALTASNAKNISNFETLSADSLSVASTATTAAYTLTQDASVLSGISTLEVRGVANANALTSATTATTTLYGGVSFTNAAGTETLNIASGAFNVSGAVANTATTTSVAVASVLNATVSVALKTNTTADAITVNLGSSSGSTLGIENNTATLTNSTQTGSAVSANSVITLSLDDYETVTLNTRAGSTLLDTLTSTGLKTLNITGNKDLTISAATAANVASIDASKFTGDLNLTSSTSTKAQTIVSGSGNDTIVADTTSRNDSIDGGAGNDTIGVSNSAAGGTGTGNDTMLGGEGNDTIYSGAGNDVIDGGAGDDSIVGAVGNDSLSGGAGNDTFKMAYDATATSVGTSLAFSSTDTIDGGDGTDSIQLTVTATATTALAIDLSGSTLTNFTNVKNVERIQYNIANAVTSGTNSLSVGDVLIGSFNNGLTVTVGTNAQLNPIGLSVDASAVLNTASTVTYTGAATVATSMTLGNGVDKYTGGTADDSAYVSNVLFLQATDTLTGGVGSDTLSFRTNGTLTLTADKFAGVTSFETFTVANTSTYNAAAKITLSDAVVVANAATATNSFTVSRTSSETGTLTVDGSTITGTNLVLTGAAGADTLTGGAFNDTITGGSGADSMTGGAGNDVFTYTAAGQASGDVVAGGDGTDTLRFNGATATSDITVDMTYASWSGIEALRLDRGASTGKTIATFTTAQLSGSTYSVAAVAGTGTGVAQITATGGSTSSTLNFSGLTPANTSSDGDTELVFVYSSTATAGQYITGSGLSDSITGGTGADTIYGGDGSDTIVDNTGVDIYYLTDSSTATAFTDQVVFSSTTGGSALGTLAGTATTGTGTAVLLAATTGVLSVRVGSATTSTAVDLSSTAAAIIYGMGSTDSIALKQSLASTSVTAVTSVATAVYAADDTALVVRGNYTSATGGFAYSSTGTDTLIIQDISATTTMDFQAVVLIGVASVTAATTGGILTFAS